MSTYDVYSKFDIEKHKKTYINYLEVIILADGTVEYAVPSHTEYLTKLACKMLGHSKEEVWGYLNGISTETVSALCTLTCSVSVWTNYAVFGEIVTNAQKAKLKELKLNGLYRGSLTKSYY